MLYASKLPDPNDLVSVGLFFAIFPPPSVAARIAELARSLQSAHRMKKAQTAIGRLHCTLHPIDLRKQELPTAVMRAREAAERIKAEAFDVMFDRTASFRGSPQHNFVLLGSRGFSSLVAFRHTLDSATCNARSPRSALKSFTPHVTLVYGDDQLIEEHPISPIRWRVNEFKLIVSIRHYGHREAGSWPLRG